VRTLIVIPVHNGSARLPGKTLRTFNGVLIEVPIETRIEISDDLDLAQTKKPSSQTTI